MGDLFNDAGEFQPDIAASMSDAQLNLAAAQLEVDLEAARAAYIVDHSTKPALRVVMRKVADLRQYLRQCGEAAGVRNPNAAVVEG